MERGGRRTKSCVERRSNGDKNRKQMQRSHDMNMPGLARYGGAIDDRRTILYSPPTISGALQDRRR
jgi:hypothetical protein